MARIRYLKPEFFTDEELADLPFEARLLFAGLWVHADKAGRLEDRPKYLKAVVFPYDKVDIEKLLALLEQKPFIIRYEADGRKYIGIPSWQKHQKPHHTEKESIIPPIPPLTEKGMEKQLKASCGLNNSEITVKEPLKEKEDKFLLYLQENIFLELEKYRDKIIEFYNYRQTTPVKGKIQKYKSEKGIDGLLRECKKCFHSYADLNECLDVTMERGWLTPDPEYLKGKVRLKESGVSKTSTIEEIRAMKSIRG